MMTSQQKRFRVAGLCEGGVTHGLDVCFNVGLESQCWTHCLQPGDLKRYVIYVTSLLCRYWTGTQNGAFSDRFIR